MTRARQLAVAHPASSQALTFYAAIAAVQAQLVERHSQALRSADTFDASLDLDAVVRAMPALLAVVTRDAPAALAGAGQELQHVGERGWRDLLGCYWMGGHGLEPAQAFAAEAVLQPFADAIARRAPQPRADGPGACPVCARQPVVGVLRDEGQSAKRSLVCGLCLSEWRAPRVACAACGETTFEKLPVYSAAELPGVRLDCCESCRRYVKTVDLTRDGTAIPIVDDIATVPLDLWAREQGFERMRPNLLRL